MENVTFSDHGEPDMGDKGSKDKGKREKQKKAKLSPKDKRKLKNEKKNTIIVINMIMLLRGTMQRSNPVNLIRLLLPTLWGSQ